MNQGRYFKLWLSHYSFLVFVLMIAAITACGDDDSNEPSPDGSLSATSFTALLSNQVEGVILPTMVAYQNKLDAFETRVDSFKLQANATNLSLLRVAYREAYLAYQAAAVHNYFANANQALVVTSNLYPIDTALLEMLVSNKSYNFTTKAQERANGFPAIDFMLYGSSDALTYFNANRLDFLSELVKSMKQKAALIVSLWSGNLRSNFVENGGVSLGSSISIQLNESIAYYEDHIRENKVGIPIGRLGPNDSPIAADPTKIEAYYQSLYDGNENFTLALLKASIEEMEDLYLGEDGQGYDDLLIAREQASVDTDIKAKFQSIYSKIDSRNSISGDESLYQNIQELVTLYKSDLLPVLNVQDADGLNDGD